MTGEQLLAARLTGRLKRDFGLTAAQFEALVVLRQTSRATLPMARLGAHLLYSTGSVSHLVDRLAERGLVARQGSSDDGRRVEVGLTAAGRALIDRALAAHYDDLDALFSPLVDDDELEVLAAFAQRLLRAARD